MFNRISGTVMCVLSIIYGLVKIFILKKQVRRIIFYTNKINKTIIENNDLEMIVIPFLNKQENIKNYFLKYHNVDIKELKITWFIPQRNKKG